MKLSVKTYYIYFLLGLLVSVTNNVYSQMNKVRSESNKDKNMSDDFLAPIKICKWKDDAKSCVNFSFDDNCPSHKKISQIFDQFTFKATFFVVSSNMYSDSLKDINARGHEIGNHSFSHLHLTEKDSTNVDFEIRVGQDMIENISNNKCLSFVEPFNEKSSFITNIASNYVLFNRNYSEYPEINRIIQDNSTDLSMSLFQTNLEQGIKSGNMFISRGHGIDGDGYSPITKDMLIGELELVKQYSDNGVVWVSTLKEGVLYENLFHELSLEKKLMNDTLIINFKNYNAEKYQDLDASPISIEIPYKICNDIKCLTDFAEVKEMTDKYVITTDLMRDATLILTSKQLSGLLTDTVNRIKEKLIVFPNPVTDILNIQNLDDISLVKIYNPEGKLLLSQTDKASQIDVSHLKNGLYLIKVITGNNNSNLVYRSRFLKI